MADEAASPKNPEAKEQARNSNEVALEMMKFIAVTTGYGKGATSAAGFSGKPNRTSEEYAESLLQLFERCRAVVDAKPESK
jgi:ATP:corrinoid adenosyltransferase